LSAVNANALNAPIKMMSATGGVVVEQSGVHHRVKAVGIIVPPLESIVVAVQLAASPKTQSR